MKTPFARACFFNLSPNGGTSTHVGDNSKNKPATTTIKWEEEDKIKSINKEVLSSFQSSDKMFFPPKRVIILTKTTRLQYELGKHNIRIDQMHMKSFNTKLTKHGVNIKELENKHLVQSNYVKNVKDVLDQHNIDVRVVTRDDFTEDLVNWCDLVISAGGDGTFLTAAAKLRNDIPLLGLNSDFIGSEGHLCVTGKQDISGAQALKQYLDGKFTWMYRQRIRVTIINPNNNNSLLSCNKPTVSGHDTTSSYLALNEVFIGETHAAKVSYYEVSVDDGPMIKQKSSGMTVCTGTGSTSWHYNINRVYEQKLSGIMDVLESMGVDFGVSRSDSAFIEEACKRFNQQLVFEPSYHQMAFSVRDPVFNATFPHTSPRGFAKKIRIKSRCSDAQLVLDGNQPISFNQGTEVILEMYPEDALRTASMTFA
uniref:NAD(+) kinase n=1 Tax=Rhabditophanes sp. KR3021 TaxID=114890 RepID=A0AC35U3D6_9BILA